MHPTPSAPLCVDLALPFSRKYKPMAAQPATELPTGPERSYEPKWDTSSIQDKDREALVKNLSKRMIKPQVLP